MNTFKFEESQKLERELWTGMMKVDITQINPDHNELKKMFGDTAKEPTYTSTATDEEGNEYRKVRLDFYIENLEHKFKSKITLFLEDRDKVSQSGNTEIINSKGQHIYVPDMENITYDWFDKSEMRIAKVNEAKLYDLIIANINADKQNSDTHLVLSTLDKIFDGNVSELREINNSYGKGLYVLLGVKEGLYQEVYTGYFNRGHISTSFNMEKSANDLKYPWKADFQQSMTLQKYVRPEITQEEDKPFSDNMLDSSNLF